MSIDLGMGKGVWAGPPVSPTMVWNFKRSKNSNFVPVPPGG